MLEPQVIDLNKLARNIETLVRRLIGEDILFTSRLASTSSGKSRPRQNRTGHHEAYAENFGYTVLEALTGGEALRICREHTGTIDLMVTDVVMPEMSGREVADRLRKLRPATKILYMSGFTDDAILLHGVLSAEDAFLQKPFTSSALASKVRGALDSSSSNDVPA